MIIVGILACASVKCIVDDPKTVCDGIIFVMDILSTNVTNTISMNMSANSDGKNETYKMGCCIL